MKYLYLLTFVTLLFSCKYQNNSRADKIDKTSISDISTKKDTMNSVPYNRVISFLNWYKKNYIEINLFDLVNNDGLSYDSTKFYSVNREQVKKYLQKIKSSGFVSDIYVNQWRKYFEKCDVEFKQILQNDGPPEGFDYDFILLTQEIDETLIALESPKMIYSNISGNKAIVKIDIMMVLTFHLSKTNGVWLIDKTENL